MLTKLEALIEDVYRYPVSEFPNNDFRDMGHYVDALQHGYTKTNWLYFKPSRDRQGFSFGDDLLLELLLMCEKVFNITIKDGEAENIKTIDDLNNYVVRSTKKDK